MAVTPATSAETATKEESKTKFNDHALIDEMDNFYISHRNDTTHFKSFDFSDVSVYGTGNKEDAQDEAFRHFHQMRLYIQSGNTRHHTNNFADSTMIICNLPEKIAYSLNSKWEAPLDFGDATTNLLLQMGGSLVDGKNLPSGTLRVSSLKIWTKTDPLTLQLTIPVLDDSHNSSGTNLVEALEILGSLCLPRYESSLGFFTPPPNPLNYSIKYTQFWDKTNPEVPFSFKNNYARIVLQLGGVLLVDHCVIEKVEINYPNTKAQIMHDYSNTAASDEHWGRTKNKFLHPLLAEIRLTISTVEGLTSEAYSRMLWARDQTGYGDGNFSTDITNASTWLNKIRNFAVAEESTPLPESNPTNNSTPIPGVNQSVVQS